MSFGSCFPYDPSSSRLSALSAPHSHTCFPTRTLAQRHVDWRPSPDCASTTPLDFRLNPPRSLYSTMTFVAAVLLASCRTPQHLPFQVSSSHRLTDISRQLLADTTRSLDFLVVHRMVCSLTPFALFATPFWPLLESSQSLSARAAPSYRPPFLPPWLCSSPLRNTLLSLLCFSLHSLTALLAKYVTSPAPQARPQRSIPRRTAPRHLRLLTKVGSRLPMELHTRSLAFPLDNVQALTSTQLALVQFHPEASPLVEERARVEFVRRRAAWLEQEKQRLEEAEKRAVAVKQEEVDAGQARGQEVRAVKQEAVEVLTLDDDEDDEVEVFTLPKKGKAARKEVRKRKASLSGPSSNTSPKRSRGSAAVVTNPTPTPTPPPPQPSVASLISGLSFRKKRSSAPVVETNPTVGDDALPFGLPGAATTNTPLELSPEPRITKPAAADFPVDILFRSSRRQPTPPPAAPSPALVIAPNPLLSRALTQNATVPTDEADRHFVFRPPPSFPVFSTFPPNAAEKGTDPLPVELVDKFVTVAIDGLSTSITTELLLRFLYRNQHRLARRPLAIKRLEDDVDEVLWDDDGDECQDLVAPFFLAYRSLEDAKLVVEGNDGKMLPDLDEYARTISARLVRGDLPEQPTAEQLQAARQKEHDVGWTWGDTSEEVRKIWWKARDIPYSRVCPRYDTPADDERIISDEYHKEADRIISGLQLVGLSEKLSIGVAQAKAVLYEERRAAWIRWTERSDKDEALAAGEKEPSYPAWPNDAAVLDTVTARVAAEMLRGRGGATGQAGTGEAVATGRLASRKRSPSRLASL